MKTTTARRSIVSRLTLALMLPIWLAVTVVGSSGPVAAGGWAVATLDAVPEPVEGTPVEIGFMVLQHGVTPIHPEGAVGVHVSGPGGTSWFPAVADEQAGQYTASVTFPEGGTYAWSLALGWFPDQDLGQIDVLSTTQPAASVAEAPPAPAPNAQSGGAESVGGATAGGSSVQWTTWSIVAGCILLLVAAGLGFRSRRILRPVTA